MKNNKLIFLQIKDRLILPLGSKRINLNKKKTKKLHSVSYNDMSSYLIIHQYQYILSQFQEEERAATKRRLVEKERFMF